MPSGFTLGRKVHFDEAETPSLDLRIEALTTQVYPTAQRKRDKERVKTTTSEKLPQEVEQHFDDCGEDFSPLADEKTIYANNYCDNLIHNNCSF